MNIRTSALFVIVTFITIYTRVHNIHKPNHACWDEIHYVSMGAHYMTNTFFFDVHPPLGKLIIGGLTYTTGYNDASHMFNKKTLQFNDHYPFVMLRWFNALLSSFAMVMVMYMVYVETSSLRTSFICVSLIMMDTSILIMSRLITLEPMVYFFTSASICLFIQSLPIQKSLGVKSACCSFLTGTFLGLLCSVKMVGLMTWMLLMMFVMWILWRMLADHSMSMMKITKIFCLCLLSYVVIPVMIYIFIFYLHFHILYKSGPHDVMFSASFQSTLLNNRHQHALCSFVPYGSKVILRNIRGAYLSTHEIMESPQHHHHVVTSLRLDGGHIWSIEGLLLHNTNNANISWHNIHGNNNLDNKRFIENDHVIRLRHVRSQMYARVSRDPHHNCNHLVYLNNEDNHKDNAHNDNDDSNLINNAQENGVDHKGDPDNDKSDLVIDETFFRLKINYKSSFEYFGGSNTETGEDDSRLKQFSHLFELQTIISDDDEDDGSCFFTSTHKQQCNWEWHEHLVSCDCCHGDAMWYIESNEENMNNHSDSASNQLKKMTFWEKFYEVHVLMLNLNKKLKARECEVHSSPFMWPFNVQVQPISNPPHLMYQVGNPVVWWPSLLTIIILPPILLITSCVQRRYTHAITSEITDRHMSVCLVLLVAWMTHYLPYMFLRRVLYVHHYIVAAFFKFICAGIAWSCLLLKMDGSGERGGYHGTAVTVTFLSFLVYSYLKFSPLAYGIDLTKEDDDDDDAMHLIKWIDNLKCVLPFLYI